MNLVQSGPQKSSLSTMLSVFLIILIILTIGIGGYALLSINQKKSLPKTNFQILSPTPTSSIKIEVDNPDNVDVGNVDADLKDIKTDVEVLQ